MEASVIIATFNGEKKIPSLLNSLASQTFKGFEVIVVVDGSLDKTIAVLETFRTRFENFRWVHQANQGRSIARNNGAKIGSGNVLVFYDDDMEPTSESLEKHLSFHKAYVGVLSGAQKELFDRSKTDIQNYKSTLSEKWFSKYSHLISLTSHNLFFTAANCSIKKADFVALTGFDERLTDAEDYDLAYRALHLGIPVYFDPYNLAIHNDLITCKSYILRQRQYTAAHAKLNLLHPERSSMDISTPLLKRMVYRLVAFRFFPWLIDNTKLFAVFPRKVRYWLYSLIIHALSKEHPEVKLR